MWKIIVFSQKMSFLGKMKIDNFYGNARVTWIKNHYADGNEKSRFHFSYYQALHDNITKRFLWKKRPTTIIFFCMGKNSAYAKNLDYATFSKNGAPTQKWKCVIKSFFYFFWNIFFTWMIKNLGFEKIKKHDDFWKSW